MADDAVPRSIGRGQWAALVVLCLGFVMVLLDQTIVNVAIPRIVDGLGAQLDQVLWVLSAYTLTFATLLILTSRLGNVFGQRNLYAAGLVVFAVGSAACGLARSPDALTGAPWSCRRPKRGRRCPRGATGPSPCSLDVVTSAMSSARPGGYPGRADRR